MHKFRMKKNEGFLRLVNHKDSPVIGNGMYPLEGKGLLYYWDEDEDPPRKRDAELFEWIDKIKKEELGIDRGYWNAEVIRMTGYRFNKNVRYFSGWIVFDEKIAVHHAWNVWNDSVLLDASILIQKQNAIQRFSDYLEKNPHATDEMERAELTRLFIEAERIRSKTSENMVVGVPPKGVRYMGRETTYVDSKDFLKELVSKYPNHPGSPLRRNKLGENPLQELARRRGFRYEER